ncbi:MAG TPA: ABC transporter ATP-binding protein [Pirellulaceae bacterium]|nr:ABC transporter ATP-binding protein [Pirellulaceae bacterium]
MQKSARRTLWELTAGQRARYAAAMGAMAVGTVFLLLVPYVLQRALDMVATGEAGFVETLIPAGVAVVVAHALHGFFTYLRGRWAAEASEGIVRQLRHRLYKHLERLPCDYHDHADTGDLVQRCSSDVETVRVFLASQVVEIARVGLFVAVAIPIMLTQDLRMTLVSACVLPVLVFFAVLFFRKVRRVFQKVDEAEGQLTTVIQENLTGIRVVRAFGRQDFEIVKFLERNGEFRDLEYSLFHIMAKFWVLSDVLVFLQTGLALIGGAYFVLRGDLTIGQWVLFFWLVRTIIWPVRHIGRVLADSSKATVAIGRIQEVLHEAAESEEVLPHAPVRGAIEIRDLCFAYRDGQTALDNLSLTIREGETVALLGPPGAGKSTLVNLLVRLYDFAEGTIHIGARELRSLNRDAVRDAFGMVLQDPFLFSRSVRENVVIGKSSAADHEVEESARAADIHENIVEFQEGYETLVGERGVTLSGGQRQRLAIARALLKQPAFLVLDDSLSAVDTKTEAQILRALAARRGKQTTILIAHRLSSMRLADRIFVLDHGRLIQQGTHEALLAVNGPYRRLWRIQGTLEEEIERDLSGAAGG